MTIKCRFYLIGFIMLAFSYCNAQSETDFTILPHWEKGDTKKMTVVHLGLLIINGEQHSNPPDTSSVYSIEVIDKTKDGYVLEVRIILNDNEIEFDFMKDYMLNFKYIIITDTTGRFKKLQNWNSLVELNKELKSKIILEAKKENVGEPELNKMLIEMNIPETKTELIEMCNNLTDVFLGSYGENLKLNDTIHEPTSIPNQHFKEGIPVTLETITKKREIIELA